MSKYTLFAPIIKMHIKEEEKLGRKFTGAERNKFMILDCNDQIIASIGNIDNKYVDVDAKLARLYGGKEYIPSKKRIAITKNKDGKLKTEDELENIYEGVKIAYEDRLKEKER